MLLLSYVLTQIERTIVCIHRNLVKKKSFKNIRHFNWVTERYYLKQDSMHKQIHLAIFLVVSYPSVLSNFLAVHYRWNMKFVFRRAMIWYGILRIENS